MLGSYDIIVCNLQFEYTYIVTSPQQLSNDKKTILINFFFGKMYTQKNMICKYTYLYNYVALNSYIYQSMYQYTYLHLLGDTITYNLFFSLYSRYLLIYLLPIFELAIVSFMLITDSHIRLQILLHTGPNSFDITEQVPTVLQNKLKLSLMKS